MQHFVFWCRDHKDLVESLDLQDQMDNVEIKDSVVNQMVQRVLILPSVLMDQQVLVHLDHLDPVENLDHLEHLVCKFFIIDLDSFVIFCNVIVNMASKLTTYKGLGCAR